ncbi:MAG TPA: DsbA family protein [Longimicrobium sp.]|jgi:protein-disulfide isomerase|uniref:DsbA family protein n=1 Tax=Longimicrobium sp. TaxID=2029185 RepID=UPI002EDA8941
MKDKLLNALTLMVAAGLVVLIGVSVANFAGAAPRTEGKVAAAWQPIAAGGTLLGVDAPVRVVVFSDFQCRYCARAATEMREMRDGSGGRIALTFRHLPLEAIHPHAVAAALASECAAEQGGFEAFHDYLFAHQQDIGVIPWAEMARATGLSDVAGFGRCLAEQRHLGRVAADMKLAEELGVVGTPTFMVNGKLVAGSGKGVQIAEWAAEPAAAPARVR